MVHNENYFNLLLTLQSTKPLLYKIVLNGMVGQSLQLQRTMGDMLADLALPQRMLSLFILNRTPTAYTIRCVWKSWTLPAGSWLLLLAITPSSPAYLWEGDMRRGWQTLSTSQWKSELLQTCCPGHFSSVFSFKTVTRSLSLCSCSFMLSVWIFFLFQKCSAFWPAGQLLKQTSQILMSVQS